MQKKKKQTLKKSLNIHYSLFFALVILIISSSFLSYTLSPKPKASKYCMLTKEGM